MLIDLLGQYRIKSATDTNQATIENMYLEEEQMTPLRLAPKNYVKDEYQLIAYPTFGLETFCTTGEATIRAMYEQNETLYVVAGNKFGSISSLGVFTQLGSNLSTSTGVAKIRAITGSADTNNQLIIIDGVHGYSYNIGTSTATFPIVDADFPQTASDLATLDDYTFALRNNSITYQISNISDSITWDTLDFASKFRQSDRIVSIISYKGEIWLLGSKTSEVWVDSDNASFPIERRPDILLEYGIAAKSSLAIVAGNMMFLGRSRTGGYGVISLENYNPSILSTKAIMYLINSFTTVSDAIGYGYAKDGHEFYELTFPTANKTLTLDVSNGSWIVRTSNISSTYGRFLGSCSSFCYGKSLIGDYNTGLIYSQSNSVFTENGTAIRRRFVSPHLYFEGKYFVVNYLQIDVQTNVGSSKTFLLEKSFDHGNNWISVGTYTIPTSGSGRIRIPSLGTSQTMTFRITTTDNFKFVILGFQADITASEW